MFQSFNNTNKGARNGPRSTGNPKLDALRGKLYVNKPDEWNQAIGMDPARFYALLSKDLPGNVFVSVELNGGGQGSLKVRSDLDGKELFWAERSFDRPRQTLKLEEVRIEHEQMRRKGIGKVLLQNQLDVAQAWGIEKLTLKAGREDGPFFWSRRGAAIDRIEGVPEDRQPVARFAKDIEDGIRSLDGTLSDDFISKARQALAEDGVMANCTIARLPDTFEKDGQPRLMSAALFDYVTEFRSLFDLSDEAQMDRVVDSLGDMDAVRARLRAEFAPQKPAGSGQAPPRL
ncbi:MAG: hypothetical protein H6867_03880 [Rhodospirillales bacterium]|nr:hypothetical protein [Rhodospirillales bacterium]MCB9996290.1 hypothetical protein [Rhodospirillales bacterium]